MTKYKTDNIQELLESEQIEDGPWGRTTCIQIKLLFEIQRTLEVLNDSMIKLVKTFKPSIQSKEKIPKRL